MDRQKRTGSYPTPAYIPHTQDTPAKVHKQSYPCPILGNHQKYSKKPKSRKKALYTAVIVVLAAVFVYASVQLIDYLLQSRRAKQEEQMIQTMIEQSEVSIPPPTPADAENVLLAAAPEPEVEVHSLASHETETKPAALIQFRNALAINPDTVGQLSMGESISTYVVQRDNRYYLRHSFSGEYSFSGAIFLDVSCSIYPQSRNLILHGHNMQDGTAFGKLSRFDDIEYLNRHPVIEFSTLYESARYMPFAAVYYSIDPDDECYLDLYQINMLPAQEFLRYISKIRLMSEYQLPVYVSSKDHILTVTTCATDDDNMRFGLFAVKRDSF